MKTTTGTAIAATTVVAETSYCGSYASVARIHARRARPLPTSARRMIT